MIAQDNKIIHSLWIGKTLSVIELLTLKSFIGNGHTFQLWVYEPLETVLPEEVVLCDANTIVPKEQVFSYKNTNKYGHGKGSVAGFSDIFRYKLLYEKGGWWVDMDVTCLKPFNTTAPYFFRNHHELKVVGNVMKCPPQSDLMLKCYQEAIATVDEHNTDWHKPIEILNTALAALGLEEFINHGVSNLDQWDITSRLVQKAEPIPAQWSFIHWQNEEWRSRNISKSFFNYKSTLAVLLHQYRLITLPSSFWGKAINQLKYQGFLKQ